MRVLIPSAQLRGLALLIAFLIAGVSAAEEAITVTVDRDFVLPEASFRPPDLSGYTVEAVRGRLPERFEGTVSLTLAEGESLLAEAIRRERGEDLRRRQNREDLQTIVVEGGAVTLTTLVEQLKETGHATLDDGVVTLRLPVMIRQDATLVIDGEQTRTLRLSTDHGAFLANGGKLYVLNTEVLGWDEAAGGPSRYVAKDRFRPFLASFIGSETYLAGSRFAHLGYAAATAYGVSLSTQPERIHGQPTDDSPSGWLIGNEFDDLYYGFYTFEARDVALVDNTYYRSVVYGIDPHDRSVRLLIAGNTVQGTREKHGIIGSRGVRDSVIYGNTSHGNAGSGIMLDRQCERNVIASNRVYDCGQGIAIYESSGNRVLGNLVAGNQKAGLRIRNSKQIEASGNTLVDNRDYAYEITAKELTNRSTSGARNDGYEIGVEASFVGGRLSGNRGLAKSMGPLDILFARIETKVDRTEVAHSLGSPLAEARLESSDSKLGGELVGQEDQLRPAYTQNGPGVRLQKNRTR